VTVPARILAVVAALAGVILGLAGLVRAAALAADGRLVWRLPSWWTELVDEAEPWLIAAAAAVLAALAVVYLVVAVHQLSPPGPPASVRVGGASVKLAALERLVAARLASEVPGLTPVRVRIVRSDGGWDVAALVDVRAVDLRGMRDAAVAVTAAELARAAGGEFAGLDLEVRRFVGSGVPAGRGAAVATRAG
jgi:hypothetical protein